MTHQKVHSPLFSFCAIGLLSLHFATMACSPGPDSAGPEMDEIETESSGSEVSDDDSTPTNSEQTVTAFEEFYPQTVRYYNLDLHMKSVVIAERERLTWGGDMVPTSLVSIDFEVENRTTTTSSLSSDSCLLILADGTTLDDSAWESPTLGFYETRLNTIQFEVNGEVDLRGAQLFFYQGARDRHVPLYIPLDAPATAPEPMVIDDLEGLTFETLEQDDFDQWRFDILSARVALNSDEHGGKRADWESKLIELRVRVYLNASLASPFSDSRFKLSVDGYTVRDSWSDNGIVGDNEFFEASIIFQIPEDTTQFEFFIDTANGEWQTVSVDLGRVSPVVKPADDAIESDVDDTAVGGDAVADDTVENGMTTTDATDDLLDGEGTSG